MSKNHESERSPMRTLVSLVLGLLIVAAVAGASFYAGYIAADGMPLAPREIEVTRETIVEREVTREVQAVQASESDVNQDGGGSDTAAPAIEPESEEAAPESEESVPESEAPAEEPAAEPEAEVEEIPPAELAQDIDPADLALFFETWRIIEQDFDGDLPSIEDLNYAMINASLDLLDDDYTRFSTAEVAQRAREDMDGSFEGIGAFVRETDDGFIQIARPMDGRPADLAGLRSNDIIIEVDGVNIVGQSIDEVINLVRGPRDTEVILGIAREGEEELLQIRIVRARIEIPTVESEIIDGDIAYIQLSNFNAIAADRLEEAVAEMLVQNPSAMILDIRDNPGGFLDTAINVGDIFLDDGIILTERNRQGLNREFRTTDGDIGEEIPLVILVNGGSASASELIAGAFRDRGRAILIGETTFGKGSVQQLRTLSDNSELRVTIARWYTPNGANITDEGLDPDIEVILPPEANFGTDSDTQLQRAIDYLRNGE